METRTTFRESVFPALAVLAAFLAIETNAFAATNVLAGFFKKVKDKGFPVSGLAFEDGTARIDVFSGGKVTRYSFDKEGKVKSMPSPAAYSPMVLKTARFSAADAAAAATSRAGEKEEVRIVTLATTDTTGKFLVGVYDKNGRFLGRHRFDSADGRWDGFDEAVGERDPLEPEG